MKIAGIITEYNPFHNGHKFHIEEAKRVTGADYVIAVMSGDFVQRGAPAMIDKYDRAAMALKNGVDIVFELPVCYATGSAEFFAQGAVSLLDRLGIIDVLCFGSESGNISGMEEAAQFFLNSSANFEKCLASYIKKGYTYPAAREKAMEQCMQNKEHPELYSGIPEILSEPNNILGLEYIKALKKIGSSITPCTIQRQASHYHDADLKVTKEEAVPLFQFFPITGSALISSSDINSATAIREVIQNAENVFDLNAIKSSVPNDVYEFIADNYYKTCPILGKDFSHILKYKLLSEDSWSLTDYMDITPDLADRMKNITDLNINIPVLIKQLKSKNYTFTRISRALTHLLLNIKSENMQQYITNNYIFYARVLGMKKEASHLLRSIIEEGTLPVITKVSKAKEQLDSLGMQMLSEDIFAAHIYNQAVYEKFGTSVLNEYKHGIVIL